jgi:hypothetical protein
MAVDSVRVAGVSLFLSLAAIGLALGDVTDRRLDARVEALEAKEEIRAMVLRFAEIVDDADRPGLVALAPTLHSSFRMDVVDFTGAELHFVGAHGLVEGFGPIMVAAQANLAVSAIAVELDGDRATATFVLVNSVVPPPELGVPVGETVLLLAENESTFVREGGVWKLAAVELVHTLAYPGELPRAG